MFGRLTSVVKNLLLINIGIYFINSLMGLNINDQFSFYGFNSPKFQPYQLFTYMFLHGGLGHIFSNMLGLFVFGPILENFWGSNRFLKFYLITGIGAGLLYALINMYEFNQTENDARAYREQPSPERYYEFLKDNFPDYNYYDDIRVIAENYDNNPDSKSWARESVASIDRIIRSIRDGGMLGASGAIFGLLMAVALLFPNTQVFLLFPPIPVKMKYLALVFGLMAIFGALHRTPGDNVAHYAHLGGMIIALILIKIWNKDRTKFY